jgi:SAM-dependent methyltransferase
MRDYRGYIERLVAQGGPHESDCAEFEQWMVGVVSAIHSGDLSTADLIRLRESFGDAISPLTNYGFIYSKPHGYAGDFEIIDRIYQRYVCPRADLAAWDIHFHTQPAPIAVRNRKSYFRDLLHRHANTRPNQLLTVLDLASGPSRAVFEFLSYFDNPNVIFECIDQDPEALEYAQGLCHAFSERIAFTRGNVLRFHPTRTYDVIWSAGLFDYFTDPLFIRAMSRLVPAIASHGELVIGNLSDNNPNHLYMDFFEWPLQHRSGAHLITLARQAGVARERITIGSEPQGVNLFLHVTGESARLG